jgi:predicted TIM-barrel fold metal-dependent hydrolase
MPKPPVIDAHLHLDEKVQGPASAAADALIRAMRKCGIRRSVVLHLATQRWPVQEVAEAVRRHAGLLVGFININPLDADAALQLRRGAAELGFQGLKLHPRLQRYSFTDTRTTELVRLAGELHIPVLIDAFPDGDWIQQGFSAPDFAAVAQACPKSRIIVGHMGGHKVLDFLMLAKRYPNLFFDLSYSLLYYRGSSVPQDIVYAIRSLKGQRIFYGSDYPDRPLDQTLRESVSVFKSCGLPPEWMRQVLFGNAKEFFGWNDI